MQRLIIILILIISNVTNAQIEKKTDTLEIWTFSIGNFINQNAEKIVSEKYPFNIKAVAGDVITEETIRDVEIHNKKIWNHLNSIGFSKTEKRFKSDLLNEIKQIKKAVDISNSDKYVIALFDKWRKNGRQNYTELNNLSDVQYEFLLYSFDLNDLDKEQTFELKYIADLDKEIIKITK